MISTSFQTYDEMCCQTAQEIMADLQANPRQMLCIAAGNTSLGIFKYLISAYQKGEISFEHGYFAAMDEWLSMNETTPGSCGSFLVKNFLSQVNYPPSHVRLWDGCAKSPELECTQVENFITTHGSHGVIDFLVLGMGMNGHLALNEPGTSFSSTAHVCILDSVTQNVGQKYFDGPVALQGGITLGIKNFRAARRTVLTVNGAHKAPVVKQLLSQEHANGAFPASVLLDFENASLYCDKDALEMA